MDVYIDYYTLPVLVIGAFLGLVFGSFLNVVIYRLPIMWKRWQAEKAGAPAQPVFNLAVPRSACPKCGHFLRARENVPVLGWVFLRGKCHHCHNPISIRYPAVELFTCLTFVGIAHVFGFDMKTPVAWTVACVVIATICIIYDMRRSR